MDKPLIVTLTATSSSRSTSTGMRGLQLSRPSPDTSTTIQSERAGMRGSALSATKCIICDVQANWLTTRGATWTLLAKLSAPSALAISVHSTEICVLSDHCSRVMSKDCRGPERIAS
jgi:hypothetical protein